MQQIFRISFAAVATKEGAIANLGLLCKRNGPFRNPTTYHRRATSQSHTTGSCILSLSNAMNELERLSRHSKQHEELGADLKEKNREIEELNNDAQELVDLVETKEKVIEELKNSLDEARNCVSAMEEEIRCKRANKAEALDEKCGEQTTHWVSTHNLDNIHEQYTKVLGILNEEQCQCQSSVKRLNVNRAITV